MMVLKQVKKITLHKIFNVTEKQSYLQLFSALRTFWGKPPYKGEVLPACL